MEAPSPSKTPIQTENPYAAQVEHTDVGVWRVGLCGGCCEDCCSCVIPWLAPCIGITEAARAVTDRSSASALGVFFGILVLGIYISDAILGARKSETSYEYESRYDYWTHSYHYYGVEVKTKVVPYTLAIIVSACCVVYWIGLLVFRGFFRGKLQLPGNCCYDCLATFFCSCCVVAQMRTHVKRGELSQDVDILPAYRQV